MSVYFAINSVFVLGKKRKLSQIILSPNYLKKKNNNNNQEWLLAVVLT